MKIYLDNAATTKPHPKVIEKMLPFLKDEFGNPSSIHSFGRKTRVAIEESREIIADFINADPSELYFTSGGTEANNFIINGLAKTELLESGRKNLITSAGEHKAVLNVISKLCEEGFTSSILNLDLKFNIVSDTLDNDILSQSSFTSIVHLNNETGKINDIKEIHSKLPDVYFHSDAVQSFGKIRIDVEDLGIHSLSASAHKFHGPKGIGLAYVKSGTPMESMILGGGQERNRRAGTENIASIVGFAEAVKIADQEMEENFQKVKTIKNYFWKGLAESGLTDIYNNSKENSSPYILSITFDPKIYNNDSEAMLMYLDINGIAASSGSACASGTLKPSHVIKAGGYADNYANGTIRFSFSAENTSSEIDFTIDIINRMAKQFLK